MKIGFDEAIRVSVLLVYIVCAENAHSQTSHFGQPTVPFNEIQERSLTIRGKTNAWHIGSGKLECRDNSVSNAMKDLLFARDADVSGYSILLPIEWGSDVDMAHAATVSAFQIYGQYTLYSPMCFVDKFSRSNGMDIVSKTWWVTNHREGARVQSSVIVQREALEACETNVFYADGNNGLTVVGSTNYDIWGRFITGCTGVQHFNDEWYNDVVIVGYQTHVTVLYGGYLHPHPLYIRDVNGTNGMRLYSSVEMMAYNVVAGDVNGDGRGDIIVSEDGGVGGTKGYVIFGKRRYCREVNLSTLGTNDGAVLEWNGEPGRPVACGDVNGDGIDDIVYRGVIILGRRAWPAVLDALADVTAFPCRLGVIGDINGDGYADTAANTFTGGWPHAQIYFCQVGYGRPVVPHVAYDNYAFFNGTNGFVIQDDGAIQTACRGSDWDGDGYEEAVFAWPLASPGGRTSAGEIYITHGGPSPAWSPYVFEPLLLTEGQSNVYESEMLTNVVIGRKGARHHVVTDNGQLIQQEWLGTWWTNVIVRSATSETVTVRYWTTNVISVSQPATILTIAAVPEPALFGLAWLPLLLLNNRRAGDVRRT